MKRQKIISLVVALALIPFCGWSAASVSTDVSVSPPYPPPQALPSMDTTKHLSRQTEEVVKLVSSGVPNDVVKSYIDNAPSTFNLSSDGIIHLQELGVSGGLLTEMLNHDRSLRQTAIPSPQPGYPQQDYGQPYAPAPDGGYEYSQPDSQSYDQLSPYGNWDYIPGYGYGWQPSYGLDYAGYPWGAGRLNPPNPCPANPPRIPLSKPLWKPPVNPP